MQTATVTRTSKETDITVTILPENGKREISTGIGFFDHMLTALTVHSQIPMQIHAKGDIFVDMIEIDLKEILDLLGTITGSSYDEELLDTLFKNFCLGK